MDRIAIVFDISTSTTQTSDSSTRRRARIATNQLQSILTNLGYNQSGPLWVSPPGRETTLVSVLCFKILEIPGLLEVLHTLKSIKLSEPVFDLLENMATMRHVQDAVPYKHPWNSTPLGYLRR
jgi:hypothetical protein